MGGKYFPRLLGQQECNKLGKMVILMLKNCRHIFGSGNDVVLDSGFCATKSIIDLEYKVVYAAYLIKKRYYWPKGFPGDLIDTHFEDK